MIPPLQERTEPVNVYINRLRDTIQRLAIEATLEECRANDLAATVRRVIPVLQCAVEAPETDRIRWLSEVASVLDMALTIAVRPMQRPPNSTSEDDHG